MTAQQNCPPNPVDCVPARRGGVLEFLRHEKAVIKREAYLMEFDPNTQWVFHRKMTWFWLMQFPFIGAFVAVDVYGTWENWATKVLLLFNLILLAYNTGLSNYANFATDFDAVSASFAAKCAQEVANQVVIDDTKGK